MRRDPAGGPGLHPTTRILVYVLAALALPALNERLLALLAVIAALTMLGRHREIWRLFRRTRWLLLLLVLTYAYSLPGEAVWSQAGTFSPTREGLAHGLLQAGRLAVLLLLLDALVLRLPTDALLSGIYQVLAPFSLFGLNRARATVRLALTLEVMSRPPTWRGMHDLLAGRWPQGLLPDRYTLSRQPFGGWDWVVFTLMPLVLLWLYV
jgi:energy-coupling factor transport system permease protein